jgi:abortive infection bacteriophage resistance protein
MKFTTPFLSEEAQADLLLEQGLKGDRATLIGYLRSVGCYRLSGYWHPFRVWDPATKTKRDEFYSDATLERVWNRYVFDRRLRLLVLDALERIEIDARTRLAHWHAERFGPFGYADDPTTLPELSPEKRAKFVEHFREVLKESGEEFVEHFRAKYGSDHPDLPVWMVAELMTFGHLVTFYRGCPTDIQKQLAARYQVAETVWRSWLIALNTVRNVCAHHSRFWNRVLGTRPKVPHNLQRWHTPISIPNDRAFGMLTVIRHCLGIVAPGNDWSGRFKALLAEYPEIPPRGLGLFPDWEKHQMWE